MEMVQETQQLFRCLMSAISRPGKEHSVQPSSIPLVIRVAEVLMDHEVSCAVIGKAVNDDLIAELKRTTGTVITDVECASFVIITGGSSAGAILESSAGTPAYPDKGATLLYLTDPTFPSVELTLTGPGIKTEQRVTIDGIDRREFENLRIMNSAFPLGVDTFIIGKQTILALPRSTTISISGGN